MRRTKAEAEQTREAVIVAAIEVFLERGVARATFDEIARAAGLTRGAIYWHFRDKLEIFAALEERFSLPNAEVTAALTSRLEADPDLDPLTELASAIYQGLKRLENHPERRKILSILWLRCEYLADMLPALRRRRVTDAVLEKAILRVMRLAAARGRLVRGWSPELAARGLFLMLNGSVAHWLGRPGDAPLVAATMPLISGLLAAMNVPPSLGAGGPPVAVSCEVAERVRQPERGLGPVLVIEDNPSSRRLYEDLLKWWGYEVRSVDSTAQAVAAIDEGFMPNAIVSDYHLGYGDNGFAAIRAVAERMGRSVPATIFSGQQGLVADGLPVLEKPVSLEQLKEAVARMLSFAGKTS